HTAHWPPGKAPGFVRYVYLAYSSATKPTATRPVVPCKSQPIGFWGCREARTVPINAIAIKMAALMRSLRRPPPPREPFSAERASPIPANPTKNPHAPHGKRGDQAIRGLEAGVSTSRF